MLAKQSAQTVSPPMSTAACVVQDKGEAKSPPVESIFRSRGEYWTLAYAGTESLVRDGKGIRYIAYLLRHAGRDIHALELATFGELHSDPGDAGELLDPQARVAYQRRLTELREELAEAKEHSNEERATKVEDEIDALTHELRRAIGLAGRDRRAASASERARLNITRSIKLALEHIVASNPALGHHLTARIKTGTFCCYHPDPHQPISWQL